MMIAELVSFQNLLKRGVQTDLTGLSTWWTGDYTWARGWSRGSVVFFTLSSLVTVFWTIGEVVGSRVGESDGNIWMSLGSVLVNVSLLCSITLFLSAGASSGHRGGKEGKGNSHHMKWYGRYFQTSMVRLLGSSGGNAHINAPENLWQGRLVFLRDEMERISNETTKDCAAMMQSMESMIQHSEARVRSEVLAVENVLNDVLKERHEKCEELVGLMIEVLRKSQNSGQCEDYRDRKNATR